MRIDVKARDQINEMQTNHNPAFKSRDNNITKKKAMAGKHGKNNIFNQSLHAYLRDLNTLFLDETYIIQLV